MGVVLLMFHLWAKAAVSFIYCIFALAWNDYPFLEMLVNWLRRDPKDLKKLMFLYNLVQILVNSGLLLGALSLLTVYDWQQVSLWPWETPNIWLLNMHSGAVSS